MIGTNQNWWPTLCVYSVSDHQSLGRRRGSREGEGDDIQVWSLNDDDSPNNGGRRRGGETYRRLGEAEILKLDDEEQNVFQTSLLSPGSPNQRIR